MSQPASAVAKRVFRILWLSLAFIWTVAVLILALTSDQSQLWVYKTFSDKVLHAAAFAVGGLLWIKAVEALSQWRLFWAIITGSAAVLSLGVAIELLQKNIPGRSADIRDFVSDVVGLLVGLFGLWLFETVQKRINLPKTQTTA